MKTVDESLLNKSKTLDSDGQQNAASQMNKDKQADKNSDNKDEDKDEKEDGTLNQLRNKARILKDKLNVKKRLNDKLNKKVFNPASKATKSVLRTAWETVIFPTCGFSLLYIAFHIFGRMVVGDKFFCKLGEEWIPEKVLKKSKTAALGANLGEKIVFGILFTIWAAAIFAIIAFFIIIISFITASWWDKAKMIIDLGWDAIKDLKDLF